MTFIRRTLTRSIFVKRSHQSTPTMSWFWPFWAIGWSSAFYWGNRVNVNLDDDDDDDSNKKDGKENAGDSIYY